MLQQLRKFFCIHAYEYEIGTNQILMRECRKCGACQH